MAGTVSGGQGVLLTIGADGMTKADFGSMQPMEFSASVGGGGVAGQDSYDGTASGLMRFSSVTRQTGTWQPAGAGDIRWDDVRLTVTLTAPVSRTVLDHAQVAGISSNQVSQPGLLIDLLPILRQGSYTCGGGTLTMRPRANAATVTWVFQRV